MSAIPTSDMPGHKKLHERVTNALDICQESKSIEFKQSVHWDDIQYNLTRTIMAMGNLRDGGIIVIGVSQNGDAWDLTGIEEKHLSSYDPDIIIDTVAKYASPPIQMDIILVKYRNDKAFLAIQVTEFDEVPFVCKKNGPDNEKSLRDGDFYIRPNGKPRTTKVTSAADMQDLLDLAAEKKARKFLETAYRIGLKPTETDKERYEEELDGL